MVAILLDKDVREEDIDVILEFAVTADPNFYVEQFQIGKRGYYSNATYIYDGEVTDGWVWPVADNRTITSTFGPRWGKFHYGIDLGGRAANGKPILSAMDGLVILSQWSDSYGNWIIIAHENGLQTRYAHMSSLTVEANTSVEAGTQIGRLGTTGHSTGPHLHFEVLQPGAISPFSPSRMMDNQYDPMVFLSQILEKEDD